MLLLPFIVSHLLYVPPSIGEPVVELSLVHPRIKGQLTLLYLGRVRIQRVLLYPLDQYCTSPLL